MVSTEFLWLASAPDKLTVDNPYNKYESPTSPNFIYSTLLHYGSVSFDLQAAGKAGAVTAAVLLAPGGDEIDFEMLGGKLLIKSHLSNL